MGLFSYFSGRNKRAILGMMMLVQSLSMGEALAHEAKLPANSLVQYEEKHKMLRKEVRKIVSHKKGIDAIKVGQMLRTLKEMPRPIKMFMGVAKLSLKKGQISAAEFEKLERESEHILKGIDTLRELMQITYSFELEEDYLRDNMHRASFIDNAKRYFQDLSKKLVLAEHVFSSYHSAEVRDNGKLITDTLRFELERDAAVFTKVLFEAENKGRVSKGQVNDWLKFLNRSKIVVSRHLMNFD